MANTIFDEETSLIYPMNFALKGLDFVVDYKQNGTNRRDHFLLCTFFVIFVQEGCCLDPRCRRDAGRDAVKK